jgi:hypothetical protein
VQDAGVLEAHAVLGSQRSSASPDRRSTGPAVLAGSEEAPMRGWIPSVEGIRADLTSVELIRSRAWCKPGGGPGTAWGADRCP